MSQDLSEQCAYHESGHVVMAYLAQYNCDRVAVLQDGSGNGFTEINYGNHQMTMLVASLVNYSQEPQIFHDLPPNAQAVAPKVAFKVCGTLLGGPASEALYKVGVSFAGNLPIDIGGPDLMRVDSIHHLLSQIGSQHNPNYVVENLGTVVDILRQEQTWAAIEQLSRDILTSPTKSLDRQQIESSLQKSGYLTFVART